MYRALPVVMVILSLWVNVKNEASVSSYERSRSGSDFVVAAQVGDCDSLFAALFLLRRHLGAVHALIANDPGKRTTLLSNRLLQQHQALQKSFRAGRAARHVDVHGQELVHPLNDGVDVVHATGVGARTHGDNPLWLEHLLVETLNDRRHLDEAGSGDNHEIRLAR